MTEVIGFVFGFSAIAMLFLAGGILAALLIWSEKGSEAISPKRVSVLCLGLVSLLAIVVAIRLDSKSYADSWGAVIGLATGCLVFFGLLHPLIPKIIKR